VGTFIEHFGSRQEFEEWLAVAAGAVRVRNVSMTTGRAPVARGEDGLSYTVTYEAEAPFKKDGHRPK